MEILSCEQARSLFDEKLDGELDADGNARLEAHLATCETCRREYEQLEKTNAYLTDFAVDVPSELSLRVMEDIKKEPKRHATILKHLRPLIALPVAALLCFALVHSPLFDGMFAAKSEADRMEMPEASGINNAGSLADGAGDKPKYDDILEDATPEETVAGYASNAIVGTSLSLQITDQSNAILTNEKNGESQSVCYSQSKDTITIERNGKTADLVLKDDILSPTDEAALNALLSE